MAENSQDSPCNVPGHTMDDWVEREITNIEKNEGPLNETGYCLRCQTDQALAMKEQAGSE